MTHSPAAQPGLLARLADRRFIWLSVIVLVGATLIIAVTAPAERTLGGDNARLVYFHGALVWASIVSWLLAGLFGAIGIGADLIWHRQRLHLVSRALGRVALLWWALYIPVSILAANATWANNSWNLTFLMEPRFKVAFQAIAIMLLVQAFQLVLHEKSWVASVTNLIVMFFMLIQFGAADLVLHPPAPIRDTESLRIQLAFGSMLVLLLLAGFQMARLALPRA